MARDELVSVHPELQVALWIGVTMIAGGAGLLVKENLARLDPATIGAGIGCAAALCIWYVVRSAPPFSWGPVASPSLAFDYVLLLGVLLIGTDLAYLETRFKLLGPSWPWHLLLLSLLQAVFAFRYDSRAVLSLALASFAAWRGVALSFPDGAMVGPREQEIRVNALLVGALFLAAGALARRAGRKAHFEPTFGNLGLLLLLGAAVAGSYGGRGSLESAWLVALAAVALAFATDCGTVAFPRAFAAFALPALASFRSGGFALGLRLAAFTFALRLAFTLRLGGGRLRLTFSCGCRQRVPCRRTQHGRQRHRCQGLAPRQNKHLHRRCSWIQGNLGVRPGGTKNSQHQPGHGDRGQDEPA